MTMASRDLKLFPAIATTLLASLPSHVAADQEPTPGDDNEIPEAIMTPDFR